MRPLTPSVAHGCLELMGVIARNAPSSTELFSLRILSIPGEDLVTFAKYLRWIEPNTAGVLALTAAGHTVNDSTDPRVALRSLITTYIAVANPAWVRMAAAGRRELLLQAPAGVRQLLVESGMADGYDEDVVSWWDKLATESRRVRDDAFTGIGRLGERLSFAYEQRRTSRDPKWIGVESNLEGYDILSTLSQEDARRLTIEVKTSQQSPECASFFLSRNEWKHACDALHHAFHLWTLSSDPPLVAVLAVEDVAHHIPADAGDGQWQNMKVPFKPFANVFAPASHTD